MQSIAFLPAAIVIVVLLMNSLSNNVFAQSTSPGNPLQSKLLTTPGQNNNTYINATNGISVTIPRGWTSEEVQNAANATSLVVVSLSPPIAQDPNASTSLIIFKNTKSFATSVGQLARDTLNIARSVPTYTSVSPVALNLALSGNPAYQLILRYTDPLKGPSEELTAGTLLKGNAYLIDYSGSATLFSTFLPQAQQIIKSFKLQPPS